MKKIILILTLIWVFASCESESDSGCGGPIVSFKNGTTFSITLVVNGVLEKTISPGQTHYLNSPPNTITYSASAGNHRWGKTLTLDSCDNKSISLTV